MRIIRVYKKAVIQDPQAFGNVGQWDHWSAASKREFKVGPALFGKIKA